MRNIRYRKEKEMWAQIGNWLYQNAMAIYNCKVGTDIELVEETGKKFFLDSNTGKIFKL